MHEKQPVLTDVGSLAKAGLICRRLPDGRLACNLAQRYKHHSPTGFECGYGGSGPADLALNVLAIFLPRKGREGVKLWDGTQVSKQAYSLYQRFKGEFIAAMPREGGNIPVEAIRAWIEEQSRDHS